MRLLIEPTATPAIINGVLCRLWIGADEDGVPVHVYVNCVSPQTHDPQALLEFDQRLQEIPDMHPIGVIFQSGHEGENPFITGEPDNADADDPIPPVTAPEPFAAVDPNYDDPDVRNVT